MVMDVLSVIEGAFWTIVIEVDTLRLSSGEVVTTVSERVVVLGTRP